MVGFETYKIPTSNLVKINVITLKENADKIAQIKLPVIEMSKTRFLPVRSAIKPSILKDKLGKSMFSHPFMRSKGRVFFHAPFFHIVLSIRNTIFIVSYIQAMQNWHSIDINVNSRV